MPLYWEATYEIILALKEQHPNVDIDSVGTAQLFNWIIALPDFSDDPDLVNEGILNDILREWYEEINGT